MSQRRCASWSLHVFILFQAFDVTQRLSNAARDGNNWDARPSDEDERKPKIKVWRMTEDELQTHRETTQVSSMAHAKQVFEKEFRHAIHEALHGRSSQKVVKKKPPKSQRTVPNEPKLHEATRSTEATSVSDDRSKQEPSFLQTFTRKLNASSDGPAEHQESNLPQKAIDPMPRSTYLSDYWFDHKGYWDSGRLLGQVVKDAEACAELCSNTQGCTGFSRSIGQGNMTETIGPYHHYCYGYGNDAGWAGTKTTWEPYVDTTATEEWEGYRRKKLGPLDKKSSARKTEHWLGDESEVKSSIEIEDLDAPCTWTKPCGGGLRKLEGNRRSWGFNTSQIVKQSSQWCKKAADCKKDRERVDEEEVDMYKQENIEEAAKSNESEDDYLHRQWGMLSHMPQAEMQVQMCLQLDLSIPQVPGLKVNIGVLGHFNYNRADNCWGWGTELSLGLSWGFREYGIPIGVSMFFMKTIDVKELPTSIVATKGGLQRGTALLPEGANKDFCHSTSPWAVLQSYMSRTTIRNTDLKAVEKDLEERLKKLKSHFLIQSFDEYKLMLDGANAREHVAEGIVLALGQFMEQLPRLSSQILERLVDNGDTRGTDGDEDSSYKTHVWLNKNILPSFMKANVTGQTRFLEGNGRHWHRWPGQHVLSGNKTKERIQKQDQRALNFVKVMHHHTDGNQWVFWKEISISIGNLFVRSVRDVQALFNIFMAGDPWWDGDCTSLFSKFSMEANEAKFRYPGNPTKERNKFVEFFAHGWAKHVSGSEKEVAGEGNRFDDVYDPFLKFKWPWTSREIDQKQRSKFRKVPWPETPSMAGNKSHRDLQRVVYPHAWCGLATSKTTAAPEEFREGYEVRLNAACQFALPSENLAGNWEEVTDSGVSSSYTFSISYEGGDPVVDHYPGCPLKRPQKLTWSFSDKLDQGESFVVRPLPHDYVRAGLTKGSFVGIGGKALKITKIGTSHVFKKSRKDQIKVEDDKGERHWYKLSSIDGQVGIYNSRYGTIPEFNWRRLASVDNMKVEDREGECEMVALSPAFVRMFPAFVKSVQKTAEFLQQQLQEINSCFRELLERDVEELRQVKGKLAKMGLEEATSCHVDSKGNPLHAASMDEERTRFAKIRYKRMLAALRSFLLKLGGDAHEDMKKSKRPPQSPIIAVRSRLGKKVGETLRNMNANLTAIFGYGKDGPIAKYGWYDAWGQVEKQITNGLQHLKRKSYERLHKKYRLEEMGKIPALALPPAEFIESVVFETGLAENGFCTENTAALIVNVAYQWTGNTFTKLVEKETCVSGRLRPGGFFIRIQRCWGKNARGESYTDWRTTYYGRILNIDMAKLGDLGSFKEFIASSGPFNASGLADLAAGATLLGQHRAMEAMAPKLEKHPWTTVLISFLAGLGPIAILIGAGVGVAQTAGANSAGVMKTGLEGLYKYMQDQGCLPDPIFKPQPPFGFSATATLVLWGMSMYRQQEVHVAPSRSFPTGIQLKTQKRFGSLHGEFWLRTGFYGPVPAVPVAPQINGYSLLVLDFDLTHLLARKENLHRARVAIERREKCRKCLEKKKGFCDYKRVLGDYWKPEEHDRCRPPTEVVKCNVKLGTDNLGNSVGADWYHPITGLNCKQLSFIPYNREMYMSESRKRMFKQR